MATQLQLRRGNTSQTAAFTGASAEVTIDTTKNTLVIHDGATPGGFPLASPSDLLAVQNVNTTQNTRITVLEGGLISANSNTVYLNSLITTNNTRISVIEGVNTTQNTNITTVTSLAQAAFDKANTGVSTSTDDYARTSANTATNNIIILQGVDTTQNTRISSADNTARAAYDKANAAFDKANTGVTSSIDDYARASSNTATNNITILQGVNTTQNTNITYVTSLAQAAFNQANTGGLVSNTGNITVSTFTGDGSTVAFGLPVTPINKDYTFITFDGATQLKSSYSLTGNLITFSEAPLVGENIEIISFTSGVITSYDTLARDIANTATNNITIMQGVNTNQNTRMSVIEGGLISANANSAYLQGALNTANTNINTKFNSSGGTITGSVTIAGNNDLIVTGNLIITGNVSTQNVQQLAVADPLLVLGIGNYVSDTKDIGFAAHYNDGANAHAGIIRDSTTKEFYVFQGYTPEVDVTNNIDITNATFRTANINANYVKGNLIATTAVVGGVNLIDVNNTQNTRISVIEGISNTQNTNITYATSLAQAALDAANTSSSGSYSIEYLVVAGGGGGGSTGAGNNGAGGGGAGGLLTDSVTLSSGETYVITVGSGGNGGASGSPNNGNRGANSSLIGTTTVTAIGGGYGNASSDIGGPGGSGGGSKNGYAGGLGTAGQGNNGGVGSAAGNCGGGGGGGAGAVGGNGSASVGGAGGVGLSSSITGSAIYYAGGGGGGTYSGNSPGAGGNGGGGAGAQNTSATSGTTNRGGGGGGTGGNSPGAGGNGGSGVVILRTTALADSTTGSPTVTYDGAFNIYTFTSSGSIVFPSVASEVIDTSARADIVTLQGVNTTQNTRISSVDNTATAAYAKANAAFDKANTGVTTSTDDYARTTANTTSNNVVILQGVNTTQNTNITYATSLAQAAYNQANTGGLVSNTGNITVSTFTGDGSTVSFNLPVTPINKDYTFITFDGATQLKASYSLSGNLITFSEAPLTGENIEIISFTSGVITSYDTVARDLANTASNNITILQGVNTTQNTRISSVDNTATAAYAKANAAFDKANTGVSTSTDDYARTTANTATNNITILQGVNATQNTNITYGTNLAQAAYNQANTGGLVSNTGIITVDTFTGDGSTVAFTLTVTPVTKNYTSITIDGATQLKSAYTLSGNIITLSEAPLTGENIEVISFTNGVITSYDTVARDIANTATNNITIIQNVNTSQNTRISVIEGGLISANANSVFLNSLITTNNTRISVIEGGLISANANTVYLNSLITTNNTRISVIEGGLITANANTSMLQGVNTSQNTRMSVIEGGLITANANSAYLTSINTTQNTNITYATSLAQAAFDKANTGSSGGSSNVTIVTSDSFVGNGSNVAFTLSTTPSSKDYTIITFDGAVQLRSSYSLTANTITFTEAPLNGENIEVTSFSSMAATTTVTINTFTGDGSTVAYTLSVSPSSKDYTFVNFDGTAQLRSSYSLSGNILTFTEAPLVGENIEVTSFTTNSTSSGTTIGKAIAMSIIFGG